MRRESETPRPLWQARCEADGFHFHSMGGTYWDESACYAFSAEQVDRLEEVSAELHRMCRRAVQAALDGGRLGEFAIPEGLHDFVRRSWERGDPSLYGRFDLSWDGRGEPKLLEYNADTPTALLEAAVVQWRWLEDTRPDADQFNSIHEKLLERWRELRAVLGGGRVALACAAESEEDRGTVEYLRDCALQAGWDARFLPIEAIGWDGRRFVDEADAPLEALFKLYPWEWLAREEFGRHLPTAPLAWIEPPWKMLLANKALLVVLWELYPGHPNLLRASFDEAQFTDGFVKKPLLAREGANVALRLAGRETSAPGPYGAEGYVYQAAAPLPDFGGRFPVVGAWIVGDEPAGMGIREDESPITRNSSRFVPHYFL